MSRKRWIAIGGIAGLAAIALVVMHERQSNDRQADRAAPRGARRAVPPTRRAAGGSGPLVFLSDADRAGTLRLEGQVIDGRDAPVEGAEVTVNTNPPRVAVTQPDGSFAFDRLVGRPYTLSARAAAGFAGPVTARLDATSDPVILRLRPGAGIEVRTLSARDDRPVAGATVELRALATLSATTDQDGRAVLTGAGPGRYTLVAWASGFGKTYQEVRVPVAVSPGAVVERLRLRLRPGAPVSGRVVSPDGAPVAGALVRYAELAELANRADPIRDAVQTDEHGAFRFEAMPAGTFRFLATDSHFAPGSSPPVTLDGAAARSGIEIRMDRGAVVAGRVVSRSGAAVGWATVRITARTSGAAYDAPRQTYADETGHFEIGGLPRRPMLLVALHESATSEIIPVDLTGTAERRDLTVVLDQDGSIAGEVVDDKGEPVAGASVWAAQKVGSGDMRFQRQLRGYSQELTDAGGRFTIHGLRPGDYILYASRTGGATPGDVRLERGTPAKVGDTHVRIVLGQDGGIKGRVLFADGSAPELFTVEVGRGAPVPFATSDGRFVLSGMPAGTLSARFAGPSFDPVTRSHITIEPGKVADLGTVTVRKGRSISGRVLTAAGEPVAGATVYAGTQLFGDGARPGALDSNLPGARNAVIHQSVSDEDGSYMVRGVGPGELAVAADHDTQGRSATVRLPASDQSATIDLVLQPFATVEGTVTRAGQPVGGIIVTAAPQVAATSTFVVSTGPDGTFRFDRLAPDSYRVSAVVGRSPKMGFASTGKVVTAESGKTVTVNLDLAAGATLLVTVATTDGRPLDRALVYVLSGSHAFASAQQVADAAGATPGFTFVGGAVDGAPASAKGVPAAHYTVCAVAIPDEVRGMARAFDYVAREGGNMPAVCTQTDVTDSPPEQRVSLTVSVPDYVPPPSGEEPSGGTGGGSGGGGGAQPQPRRARPSPIGPRGRRSAAGASD